MSKRVLTLLAPGFEEIEMVTPVDLLRRAGAEVTLASIESSLEVTGRNGITVRADVTLAALPVVETPPFDLLLLPGGPGVAALRADQRVRHLVNTFAKGGRWIGAICAAPTILGDAGLLQNKRFTSHFSVQSELPESLPDERVVIEEGLVTSRGAGTSLDFGLALVRLLYGEAQERELAAAIMA